ncbi:50S ribosomal protein L10 [Halosquirtibacter laminarini]|uniref:50S ribosomal protein L10 n=1 Tax=Halosquirtibacter laminarini TaxID=3374600 RepID=A0AC61NC85_9BACT|nr:50S ribosomal protein L10 [Prolixibacteraceae bacterium]
MRRSEKQQLVESLKEQLNSYSHFYLADVEALDAEQTSALRRLCFQKEVKLVVAKNTLLRKAIEESDKDASGLFDVLKGSTSVLLSNIGNVPAKLIKDFGKENGKPVLKGAFVEESVYVGAETLEELVNIKSKEELVADVIALLQSPAKNVISALQSSGQTITGVLKALEEKNA